MITQKSFYSENAIQTTRALKTLSGLPEYKNASAVLAQVYVEVWDEHFIKPLVERVQKALPKAMVVGMTAINHEVESFNEELSTPHGIVFDAQLKSRVVINALMFEQSELCLHVFEGENISEFIAGGNMGLLLSEEKDAKGVLLLTSGYDLSVESYLAMATAENNEIPFFGAVSSYFKNHAMFVNKMERCCNASESARDEYIGYVFYAMPNGVKLVKRGFLNVVFKGSDLHIRTGYNFGWTPIGKELSVDEMEGERIVRKIDGGDAAEIYKKYLGLRSEQLVSENVCEFPLAVRRGNRYLARMGFHVEDDPAALRFSSSVFEGDKLRLTYGNPDDIFAESSRDAQEVMEFQAQGVLLVACLNRTVLLKGDISIEHDMFKSIAPELMILHGNAEILFDKDGGGELGSALVSVAFREGEKDASSTMAAQFRESCPYRNRQSVPLLH